MQKAIAFESLVTADLVIDALYEGGNSGNTGDDPITKLLNCGNQGGFRYKGSLNNLNLRFVVLYTSLADPDWPDFLDEQTGQFIYFGDNKSPGHILHDTNRKGNVILREVFNALHNANRSAIPPFFIFQKGRERRDVIFRGIAVPGAKGLSSTDDLVAVWKSKNGQRFQNYKAVFTILNVSVISREWIEDLKSGNSITNNTPPEWINWIRAGFYNPLTAQRSIEHRSKEEQVPTNTYDIEIINEIYEYFEDGYSFEHCAVEIVKLMDKNIIMCDLTRPWVDGGRDAIGKYRIGLDNNSILVDFALEAKRYNLSSSVGVRETSRLISRLRYRQFGILITTSYLHSQAYKEIKEDGHPVIIVCARDIVEILKRSGLSTKGMVKSWLEENFARSI